MRKLAAGVCPRANIAQKSSRTIYSVLGPLERPQCTWYTRCLDQLRDCWGSASVVLGLLGTVIAIGMYFLTLLYS